jgi:glycosyltransferase involved in cell wall biosynthesis
VNGAIAIDVAGAAVGGSGRLLVELDDHLASGQAKDVAVVGRGRSLTVPWMGRREVAVRGSRRAIAANNASFLAVGDERWVLVRNLLHFMSEDEARSVGIALSKTVRAQGVLIRQIVQRSDVIVAPSSEMAERVCHAVPAVRDRVVVRFHPVGTHFEARPDVDSDGVRLLCPVVCSPYKRMPERIGILLRAMSRVRARITLVVTATSQELGPALTNEPRIEAIGRLSFMELRDQWRRATAVWYPTTVESFGYPLAEARAAGLPVVAVDSSRTREIGGSALVPYAEACEDTLEEALTSLSGTVVAPDPVPFDPQRYFDWLLFADV